MTKKVKLQEWDACNLRLPYQASNNSFSSMAKLNSAEQQILKDISDWKDSGSGFLNTLTHITSKPILWAGDKLIPDSAKETLGQASEKVVDQLQDLSTWTVNEEEVLKATREFEIDSDTILELKKASVFDLETVGKKFIGQNSKLAAAEGFGTGLIGWAGLVADLPALFTLAFRTLYQISLCYGYPVVEQDGESPDEFEIGFMLRIFRVATASNSSEKEQALLDLADYESEQRGDVTHKLTGDFTAKQISKNAAINISRMIINQIIKQTFARKAITSIPGIGAVLTAGFNYSYIKDVGEAADMIYKERFLLDKKGRKKIVNIEID